MVEVRYLPPYNTRERLLALRPYRAELISLMTNYRCSSREYRKLLDALSAMDDAIEALGVERTLLHAKG